MPLHNALGSCSSCSVLFSCVTGKFVPDNEWFQAYLLLLGLDWICVLQNTIFLKITLLFLKSTEQLFSVVLVFLKLRGVIQPGPGSCQSLSALRCSRVSVAAHGSHQEGNTLFHNGWDAIPSSARKCSFLLLKIIQSKAPLTNIFFLCQYIHMLIVQVSSQPDGWTIITVFCWQISKMVTLQITARSKVGIF